MNEHEHVWRPVNGIKAFISEARLFICIDCDKIIPDYEFDRLRRVFGSIKVVLPEPLPMFELKGSITMEEPVKLTHVTKDAEKLIAYCARVSSPNQENPNYAKLLAYCINNQHWSIFEMASMCVEISTSRAIAQQILRHRSFSFQEFSQRYAPVDDVIFYEARRQDQKNRQNSVDDLPQETKDWFIEVQKSNWARAKADYDTALDFGIAKECARFLLPLEVRTKMYMHGTIRSWIHYLNLRTAHGTQKEHKEIAAAIKAIFIKELPTIAEALEWIKPNEN